MAGSRHIGFYKDFGRPIAKCLLIASASYMFLHYTWWKLETSEMRMRKSTELGRLSEKAGTSILAPPK
jgi:hypothetical protein